MLDRKLAPENNPLQAIELLKPEQTQLSGGARAYIIDGAGADVVRIEFIFPHTGWDAQHPLLNRALPGMLLEGTGKRTAREIAEAIDFYGAFLHADAGADHSTLTLHTLTKHLGHTLPVVKEVLTEAVFPENELEVYRRNNRQKLQVSLEKNEFQARRKFNNLLFGEESPYGYMIEPGDYDRINRDQLLEMYPRQFSKANCSVLISGKAGPSLVADVAGLFEGDGRSSAPAAAYTAVLKPAAAGTYRVDMPGSVQSAIRIGKPLIHKAHPDYPELQVLNTILGGYFGSRLMANIREDKGFTYGIGSGLYSFKAGGVFVIATEVGVDVREQALDEIYKEIARLRTDLVPAQELELVRNYMLGSFMGSLENVFSHTDKFKALLLSGLDYSYYDRYFNAIRTVQPERLRELANTYFSEPFYEVTAG